MIDHLFIIGYPSAVGGANTELWHTVKLWRRFGLDITLLPTWQADRRGRPGSMPIGCRTIPSPVPASWKTCRGWPAASSSPFCNTKFLAVAERSARSAAARSGWAA